MGGKVKSVVEKGDKGDKPSARFGHTATLVGDKVIVFGGCLGDMKEYTITGDGYTLDLSNKQWSKLQADNGSAAPCARAAHAAACVEGSQLVIYGGATGGGALVPDELHVLDFKGGGNSAWMPVPVTGGTPGKRYGHTMVFNKPLLIVCGGSVSNKIECDIWILDVEHSPFQWTEINVSGKNQPLPRVYHTAEVCREGPASGMMILFGGRTKDNRSLKDVWGLRQHRDRRWDWVEAPTKKGNAPEARFQHIGLCFKRFLLIIGGRGSDVNKTLPTCIYDTESCEWKSLGASSDRFRTAAWIMEKYMQSFGGFEHDNPNLPTNAVMSLDLEAAFSEAGLKFPGPQKMHKIGSVTEEPDSDTETTKGKKAKKGSEKDDKAKVQL
ncbi:unnamed protein product [Amoebophrya sp. A25]|nr:unnamed protein product [Amoebophrya sp. A25]|eukprot:GSA25T00003827001.1